MSPPRTLRVVAGMALFLGCWDDIERPPDNDDPAGAPGDSVMEDPADGYGGIGGSFESAQGGGHPDSGGGPNVGPVFNDIPGLGDQPGQTGGFGIGGAPTQ